MQWLCRCCSDVLRDTPCTLKNSCGTLAGGGALAPKALWPRRCVLVPAQAMDERERQVGGFWVVFMKGGKEQNLFSTF